MSDFMLDKSHAERELLKQVAEKVDRGENQKAIILLQEALELHNNSELILHSLIHLYQQLGQQDIAYKYTQNLLNLQSTQVDLPSDSDFDYLDAQLQELREEEYSFDEPIVEAPAPRKTLSLKGKHNHQPSKYDEKSKIVVKNRFKHVLEDHKPKPDFSNKQVKVELTVVREADEPNENSQTPSGNHHSQHATLHNDRRTTAPPVCPASLEATRLSLEKTAINCNTSNTNNNLNEMVATGLLDSTEQSYTQPTNQSLALEENAEFEVNDIAISDFDWLVDEFDSVSQQTEADYFGDFEVSLFEENESTDEFCLYDFWDDTLDENEANEQESGVFADTLTLRERAKLVAVEFITAVNWDKSTLPFFTEVFTGRGWNNIKTALEREVNAGTSFEELQLAFEIKTLWLQSSRYWIAFSRAYGPGESTDAIYRHCSWSQALRLLRVFESIPELEEVYDFLEHEFELWFNHDVLRKCFPAFTKYLFNYRLHERNIPEFTHGFYGAAEYEQADLSWVQFPLSDEMRHLRELGLDLLSLHAPKVDYVSDKYTFDYLYEYWHSTAPDSERDTDNDK